MTEVWEGQDNADFSDSVIHHCGGDKILSEALKSADDFTVLKSSPSRDFMDAVDLRCLAKFPREINVTVKVRRPEYLYAALKDTLLNTQTKYGVNPAEYDKINWLAKPDLLDYFYYCIWTKGNSTSLEIREWMLTSLNRGVKANMFRRPIPYQILDKPTKPAVITYTDWLKADAIIQDSSITTTNQLSKWI